MQLGETGVHGDRVRGRKSALSLLIGLSIILGGCNSTDALVPPLDVGVSSNSTPLTQTDLDRASANADQYASRQHARAPTPDYSSNSYQPSYNAQNTLDAQAEALQSQDRAPQQQLSSRLYQQPAPGSGPQQNQMLPAPVQPDSDQTAVSLAEQEAIAPQPDQTVNLAPPGRPGTIRFLPIIGAPVSAVTPLSRELGSAARSSGLTILPSADENASNILKGYLSAFEDGDNVNIVYVWDILDSAGNRLHRLQGQQSAPKDGNDPWASASTEVMQEIARKTIADYSQWKNDHKN